jgi:hypothetical protein
MRRRSRNIPVQPVVTMLIQGVLPKASYRVIPPERQTVRGELPESAFFAGIILGMFRLRDAIESSVSSLNMTAG